MTKPKITSVEVSGISFLLHAILPESQRAFLSPILILASQCNQIRQMKIIVVKELKGHVHIVHPVQIVAVALFFSQEYDNKFPRPAGLLRCKS